MFPGSNGCVTVGVWTTIGDLHFSIKLCIRLLSPEVQSRACRRKAFDWSVSIWKVAHGQGRMARGAWPGAHGQGRMARCGFTQAWIKALGQFESWSLFNSAVLNNASLKFNFKIWFLVTKTIRHFSNASASFAVLINFKIQLQLGSWWPRPFDISQMHPDHSQSWAILKFNFNLVLGYQDHSTFLKGIRLIPA